MFDSCFTEKRSCSVLLLIVRELYVEIDHWIQLNFDDTHLTLVNNRMAHRGICYITIPFGQRVESCYQWHVCVCVTCMSVTRYVNSWLSKYIQSKRYTTSVNNRALFEGIRSPFHCYFVSVSYVNMDAISLILPTSLLVCRVSLYGAFMLYIVPRSCNRLRRWAIEEQT